MDDTIFTMSNLGVELKRIRIKQNMTLRELKNKSGIHVSILSQLENDKWIPTFRLIKKVLLALKIKEFRIDIETEEFALIE